MRALFIEKLRANRQYEKLSINRKKRRGLK